MRTCRSCSPRSRPCLSTSSPCFYKPSCLPRRRCQSLSPKRPVRQFYEHQPESSCEIRESFPLCNVCRPYASCYSLKGGKGVSITRSPCAPRACCFGDSRSAGKCCVPRRCESTARCKYIPRALPYSCRPDSCFTGSCEPCAPKLDYCYPRKYDKCDSCYPWGCRTSYRPKWNSCMPCEIPKCNTYCPLKCDMCYTPRLRTRFDSSLPRTYCDTRNPCYSSYCGPCSTKVRDSCRPRYRTHCDNSSAAMSGMKVRDLACDKFRKVCYPKEVPIKSCAQENCACDVCNCSCFNSSEPVCGVPTVDCAKDPPDGGPSENFYEKSRRLGQCMERYEPHLCPWEADVSISGTVRGHCTSTTVEVARRMSGRFRAEGDRYTTDALENKTPCLPGVQLMSLGRLDDGTALNFSRNNDPSDKIFRDKSELNESLKPTYGCTNGSCRSRKNQHTKDRDIDYKKYYTSACRENSDRTCENTRDHVLSTGQHRSIDNVKDQKLFRSKRLSGHCVRFGSDNEALNYQNATNNRGKTNPIQKGSTSCSEVQSFLNSRIDRRRRNKVSSPSNDISKDAAHLSSPIQRVHPERYLNVSPNSNTFIQHKAQTSSDEDSQLFTPPTHRSPLVDGRSSEVRSIDDLDKFSPSSLGKEDSRARNRHTEYREISFEGNRIPLIRRRNLRKSNAAVHLREDNMRREHY